MILRISRSTPAGEPHVWYEYALRINDRIERQPPHMMASADSAAHYARQQGHEPCVEIIDLHLPAVEAIPDAPAVS
ncbi:hypothetical protein [Brevundimonas diminuta]|uniref:hypothetical protein n=1 Tax=Brevundimonas diminuta TaxID=293 RepID=UPI003CFE5FB6